MIYGFVQDSPVIENLKQQRAEILSYAKNHALIMDERLSPAYFNTERFKENNVLPAEKTFRPEKTKPEICRLLNIPRASLFAYVKDHPELKPEAV